MFLRPGMAEEYRFRHARIFPELKQLLTDSGVRNYSIFLDPAPNLDGTYNLYAYQETIGDGGSQDLGQTEVCQRWWAYMADIMLTNEDLSPVSISMSELFHMD